MDISFSNLVENSIEASIVILLTMAVGSVLLMRVLRLPSMLAYLLIGVVISFSEIDLLPGDGDIRQIAEFGIAFLMFSIGLEFNIARLVKMRRKVLRLGPAQMLATAVVTMIVTWIGYDQGWKAGLTVGIAIAMSSTAIMAKLLTERFELHSRHGRRTMAVLLFQDLAVVPCLILIPALGRNSDNLVIALVGGIAIGILTLLTMIWAGRKIVNGLFNLVSRFHSPELFMLTVLWLVFSLSYVTESAGLSAAMGAFIGGILVSETFYRHEVEADIRPFRDLLLGLFFVSIGFMLNVDYVLNNMPLIALGLTLLIIGKGLVAFLVVKINRAPLPVSIRTAAQLAMAGEFGIVLLTLAFSHGLLTPEIFQSTLAIMLLSMFLAPFIIDSAKRIAEWSEKSSDVVPLHNSTDKPDDMNVEERHVLICGFGRTGHMVAEFLNAEAIAWSAIDINPLRIQEAAHELGAIIYGRAERPEILNAAGLKSASLIVICFPDPASVERMLTRIRKTRPDVAIIVRAPDDTYHERLVRLGATEVIPEVFESGLSLAEVTMRQLNIPLERTIAKLALLRQKRYQSL